MPRGLWTAPTRFPGEGKGSTGCPVRSYYELRSKTTVDKFMTPVASGGFLVVLIKWKRWCFSLQSDSGSIPKLATPDRQWRANSTPQSSAGRKPPLERTGRGRAHPWCRWVSSGFIAVLRRRRSVSVSVSLVSRVWTPNDFKHGKKNNVMIMNFC